MQDYDLLSAVQPDTGWFAILGIKDDRKVQKIVPTREEAEEEINRLANRGHNVFFAVAKFKDDSSRKKENVQALKAFWLDLDCGPDKAVVNPDTNKPEGYATQKDALTALRAFVDHTGLPVPTLVNSGRGIHAYWPLDNEITRTQWEFVSQRLKEVCHTQGLYVDNSVFEVSRVLRVPGTLNYKEEPPLPVQVLKVGATTSLDEMKDILGVKEIPEPKERKPLTALGQMLAANTGFSFNRIMQRSMKGDGCRQLKRAYEERATISYTDWFYALSVAAMCDDSDTATHKLSSGHDGYDPDMVDAKVATIKMATSCAKFKANNPTLCEGCPHFGKIIGPKELGKEFLEATEADNELEGADAAGIRAVYKVPEFPYPFVRGKNGGIYLPDPDGEKEPQVVYEHDLYVVKCMRDKETGHIVVFRLHLPMEGVEEFTLPLRQVTDKAELRKALSSWGVVISAGKRLDALLHFIELSVKELQIKKKAEIMRQQFGWADNDTKFIIGSREYSATGSIYSPPAAATTQLASYMQPTGELDQWKKVWDLYGDPELAPNAFAALTAFGAPLLKFLKQTGAVINLYNSHSGTGKTTILNMINSVYGHPKELRLKEKDTYNGKLQWIGMLNNLPATMDEITNMDADDFSDLLYSLSNGKGKERMVAGTNELRINNTTWQTTTVCTSNAAFTEKLATLKTNPEGELMRLFEYTIHGNSSLNTHFAQEMFDDVLFDNYGLAGPVYMDYVLRNKPQAIEVAKEVQSRIDVELGLEPKERFWSATAASNLAGGLLAKRARLIQWDMKPVFRFACERIEDMRRTVRAPKEMSDHVIGEFLYHHMQNMLVINGEVDRRTNMEALPKREPRGELLIRIEPDTKRLYIVAKALRDYCVKYQINFNELLTTLKRDGKLLDRGPKRLAKGTELANINVHSLVFDLNVPDFVNLDNYTEEKTDDNGGGS